MRFCDDGHIEIDNNSAEGALRTVAIGRNYVQFPIMRSTPKRGAFATPRTGICEMSDCT